MLLQSAIAYTDNLMGDRVQSLTTFSFQMAIGLPA